MKNILEATYHLMFFKTYTNMPRWMEIGYGIIAWGNVAIIILALILLHLTDYGYEALPIKTF